MHELLNTKYQSGYYGVLLISVDRFRGLERESGVLTIAKARTAAHVDQAGSCREGDRRACRGCALPEERGAPATIAIESLVLRSVSEDPLDKLRIQPIH